MEKCEVLNISMAEMLMMNAKIIRVDGSEVSPSVKCRQKLGEL